ncbi:replication-relaxation family protein [Paenisporosarcina sp. NPDC076898]|uniref:replication-relaxation family protein n=1 Tax=unclassified Paenisporosarcina TaxID=2642018 RepID=UPI003CFF598D
MRKRLSNRDERILLLLKRFDFLTRDQLNRYFKFGTVRNTNKILERLSPYLLRIRDGYQSVYYLSKDGREYVGCEKIRKKGGHVQHAIMRNEYWLFVACPPDWKNEVKVSDGRATVIVDAMFMKQLQYHFLEVDNSQQMKENRIKIARYKELAQNGLIAQKLGHFPTVVWLTTTELRRKQLQEVCGGLPNVKVYTINELK